MAAYEELFNLMSETAFRNKVAVAVCVAADGIRTEAEETANHANRVIWAKRAFENPLSVANDIVTAIIIANKSATAVQILGALDPAIQANVDAVVDIFAQGA
jgi:hypothetical protein